MLGLVCFMPRRDGSPVLETRCERAEYRTRYARECHWNVNRLQAGKRGSRKVDWGLAGRGGLSRFATGGGAIRGREWSGMRQRVAGFATALFRGLTECSKKKSWPMTKVMRGDSDERGGCSKAHGIVAEGLSGRKVFCHPRIRKRSELKWPSES